MQVGISLATVIILVQHTGYSNRAPCDEQTHDHIASNKLYGAKHYFEIAGPTLTKR